MGNFNFANLGEAEPEEEEPNAPAPPAQAERQRVYQLMKESTFQKLLGRGVPIQMSGQPSLRGYVTAYMDLTPEQRRELESGWSGMRTSPTFSKNLSSMASANRGRGYGGGYGGGGGQRNRSRSRSRERRPTENNRGTRNRNRNRNKNENNRRTRNALRNRERAEQNARRNGHASILPDANDDQLADLLSGLRF